MVKNMVTDILFAEADRNYCKIHTAESSYLLSLPLGSFEERLESDDFMRIHRSHIINILKIKKV